MKQVVIENPVINSPFEEPQTREHLLNDHLATEQEAVRSVEISAACIGTREE
jgi:hypothetical protein